MRKCPLSYEEVEGRYLPSALRRLHPRLGDLLELPYTTRQLREEASERADKLSIQGVQPKLSARLNLKEQRFELVDRGGRFILKPQHPNYRAVPENEDLTMKFAALAGIEVPDHGLVSTEDRELTYWIRRFDRVGRKEKLPVEDFAQLLGESRDTKYRSSLEKVAEVLERFATFPRIEAAKLLRLVLFCFLCGNEDQHLKNFSLIQEAELVRLSPAYDLLSTTTLLRKPEEESALPLRGKKNRLKADDFLGYYAGERLGLTDQVVESVLRQLAQALAAWPALLERSFLPEDLGEKYRLLVEERSHRLGFALVHLPEQEGEALDRAGSRSGSGRHQTFFRELRRQRHTSWLCVTPDQVDQICSRQHDHGGWQTTYVQFAKLIEASSDSAQ